MCGRLDLRFQDPDLRQLLDDLKLANRVPKPHHDIPVRVRGAGLRRAQWGIPMKDGGIYVHARIETAAKTWHMDSPGRRGIVPVAGWWEDEWYVTGTSISLAVLCSEHRDGLFVVIATQDPGPYVDRIERFPIPLTPNGAERWLADGDYTEQVQRLKVRREGIGGERQQSFLDESDS